MGLGVLRWDNIEMALFKLFPYIILFFCNARLGDSGVNWVILCFRILNCFTTTLLLIYLPPLFSISFFSIFHTTPWLSYTCPYNIYFNQPQNMYLLSVFRTGFIEKMVKKLKWVFRGILFRACIFECLGKEKESVCPNHL